MAWKTRIVPEHRFVEMTYTGMVPPAELTASVAEAGRLMSEAQLTCLLADCSELLGGHSVFDLYYLAEAMSGTSRIHSLREAVVLPKMKNAAETAAFWETTASIRGLDVQAFATRAEALAWLCSPAGATRAA